MNTIALRVFSAVAPFLLLSSASADWPAIRGENMRAGFTSAVIQPPFQLAWERHFDAERLGTAVEPVVSRGKVFIATHAGNLYALHAETGAPLWRFQAHGPFLHSPACAEGMVVAASADGAIYVLDEQSGQLQSRFTSKGGFSASPAIANGVVFIGTRSGDFLAYNIRTHKLLWHQALGAPVRQTAALDGSWVFVTAENLVVHCFEASSGKVLWSSAPLAGQTARDHSPIIVRDGDRTLIIVLTNPLLGMAQRIGRDRALLSRNAGVDESSWKKTEAWMRSEQARGTPELWAQEQETILKHLDADPNARSFYVLDAATGREAFTPPVLWVGGCQGVGVQPALTSDGRLVVLYRSAYGNWNLGVAPLVALGLLDLTQNRITPLFHQHGSQPPWNTFWGTADEAQTLQVAGSTVLIVHQGTLSGFDLESRKLFTIWGRRDTYGGFLNPPWARNEWHGPARGGVALAGDRIYWQTGSRLLCIVSGKNGEAAKPTVIRAKEVAAAAAPNLPGPDRPELKAELRRAVSQLLEQEWAPLFVEPGLAGRDFAFDHSGEYFEALAWASPHLTEELRKQVESRLAKELVRHPPFSKETWYQLGQGTPREWFRVPIEYRTRAGNDPRPHPFGNFYSVWLHAERCAGGKIEHWPDHKAAFEEFIRSGWRLDSQKGDLFANRYLGSLLAFARAAEKHGDSGLGQKAKEKADETVEALVAWWKRAADTGTMTTFDGTSQLDPFIGRGDGISLRISPHRHKLALFRDLSPEVAAIVKASVPEAVEQVWKSFSALHQTWPLIGEERQVHYGENFIDPPDMAMSAFRAFAWFASGELSAAIDLPFCRADLYYITKLSIALERNLGD
jgi:outer membrane protein assembly factor BamB